VGDLLKKRAEADRAAATDAEQFTTEPHRGDCPECIAARKRAQLIGVGVGAALGAALVVGVVVLVRRGE